MYAYMRYGSGTPVMDQVPLHVHSAEGAGGHMHSQTSSSGFLPLSDAGVSAFDGVTPGAVTLAPYISAFQQADGHRPAWVNQYRFSSPDLFTRIQEVLL